MVGPRSGASLSQRGRVGNGGGKVGRGRCSGRWAEWEKGLGGGLMEVVAVLGVEGGLFAWLGVVLCLFGRGR